MNQVLKFNGTKFVAAADATESQSISYEETIGNNTDTTFTIVHNLGTKDLNVIVRESINPYDVVDVRWEATTVNSITLDFESAPTTNSKRVAIKGPGTKEFYSTTIGDGSNSTIVVNHKLGSRNVIPVVRNIDSPFEVVEALSYATSLDSVTLDFSTAPEAVSLLVSVYLLDVDNSYFSTIGDGTNNEFTITHNLNTRDIGLTCRAVTSPYEFVSVRWEATTANTAKVIFSAPPSLNSRKIGIYKSLGGSKEVNDEVTLDMLDDVSIASPATYQVLGWDGGNWTNTTVGAKTRYTSSFTATGLTYTGSGATHPGYNSHYARVGDLVTFAIKIDMSTITNFGTGQYNVELPFLPMSGALNHFEGWVWVDPSQPADDLNGHIIIKADHLANTKTLDLHWLKAATSNPKPVIESLFSQGVPVTLTTSSILYINGTYITE